MSYFEFILNVRTLDFVVPNLENLAERNQEIDGKTALVCMNSLVLGLVIRQAGSLEHFQSLAQDEQDCLGKSMSESGCVPKPSPAPDLSQTT